MATLLFDIKSTATTEKGIIEALEKNSDFLNDMDKEERVEFVHNCIKEGSIEADGKKIKVFML